MITEIELTRAKLNARKALALIKKVNAKLDELFVTHNKASKTEAA